MTTSKHTPGPWTVGNTITGSRNEPVPEGLTTLFRVDGIAVYARHGTLCDDPAADARLAAAAPDLLAALREIANIPGLTDIEAAHLNAREAWHAALSAVHRRARAALAKAGA